MADLPIALGAPHAEHLARVLDVEGKIARALDALGPIAGRDVLLLDGECTRGRRQIEALGGRVRCADSVADIADAPAESVDVILAWWSAFRGVDEGEVAEADRVLRPGGRLLVVHDYGRDDVARLRGDLPEYSSWSRREGPFLQRGFRIRVVHCWWTFDTLEEARDFLAGAFGERGREVGAELKRPRLSYNVAIYHRDRGGDAAPS